MMYLCSKFKEWLDVLCDNFRTCSWQKMRREAALLMHEFILAGLADSLL